MPHINKALSKAKLQWPKGISRFRHPVTQHENDSKRLEYSDLDAHARADSDDEGTLEAVKAMQTLLTSLSPFPIHARQDCEVPDIPDSLTNPMGKLTDNICHKMLQVAPLHWASW